MGIVVGLLTMKGARAALYLRFGIPIEADNVHWTMKRNGALEVMRPTKGTERN